jgi:hypothetical protein
MNSMRRALALVLAYLSWNAAFRLVILSLVTYFMARSGSTSGEISETTNTNLILVSGLASLSFLFVLTQLNPIATVSRSEIITEHLVEYRFYPAFLRGAVFACIFAFAGLAGGYYHYVGFFIQSDTPGIAILGLLFRAVSILFMVYVDEFVFRARFLTHIRDGAHPARSIILCALFYTLSKLLEFHLGWAHLITLALLGTALSLRSFLHRNFAEGAGILAGFLMVAHCGFSLPIFGNESHGILLLRYNFRLDLDAPTIRFLTGGLGGPLSSIVIQSLLLFDICGNLYRGKKSLWPLRSAEIR